jgi:selenocysteine lyase/cysteine desulfurase
MRVDQLRALFPILARKTYLNSGSYAPLALSVRAAFDRYLDDRLERGADWPGWVMRGERLRAQVAALLNAEHDEIAITASASAGINAIASALDLRDGRDGIVVSNFEFPTSGQIWHAQERLGARIVHVPEAPDGSIPLEHFERAIDERTRLVAISDICYRNGRRLDVPGIVKLAHARGAWVLLDCFQSVGALNLDVRALDVDFAVGGMLKYLLGTAGIGFVYARRALLTQLQPTQSGWFAQANPNAMDVFHNDPAPDARRFQAGTPPVPSCYAAEAGLDLIAAVGVPAIEKRIRELTALCIERVQVIGASAATSPDPARRGPMVAIRSTNDAELVARLAEQDIVLTCRDGNIRAMFHAFNDESDIAALVTALEKHRALLR